MRLYIWVIYLLVAMVSVGCYDRHSKMGGGDDNYRATISILELRRVCSQGYHVVNRDLVCVGRISTSDKEGNFYRSLFVEDGTASIEVLTGTYQGHISYPEGLKVALRLNGCAIALNDNTLQMGLVANEYDSPTELREFESQVLLDRHIVRSEDVVPLVPAICEVATLREDMCGCLVCVESVRHEPLLGAECSDIAGYHRFVASDGNDIYCSVSEYASFADMAIPEGDIAISGILAWERVSRDVGYKFVIRPRSQSDLLNGAQNLYE